MHEFYMLIVCFRAGYILLLKLCKVPRLLQEMLCLHPCMCLKKSHASEQLSVTIVQEKKLFKEYACLSCDQAICSDCSILGQHKDHNVSTIQKGYEKVVERFESGLDGRKGLLEESDAIRIKALVYFDFMSEKYESAKQEIVESTKELLQAIKQKTAEAISVVDKELYKLKNTKVLTTSIERFKEIVNKYKEGSCKHYYDFAKDNKELKSMKAFFDEWMLSFDSGNRRFKSLELEKAKEHVPSIREYDKRFIKESKELYTDSSIVESTSDKLLLFDWISEAYKTDKFTLKLLWKGSTDGFEASTFHSKRDDKGTTVAIVASEYNHIFGGYTIASWSSTVSLLGIYKHDPEAFIFSLTHKAKHSKQKEAEFSIYCSPHHGPTFGKKHDIYVCDRCNIFNASASEGNCTYELPQSANKDVYFAGAKRFRVKDIEVYSVIIH
eukprot:TRINITY_DN3354_c0_g5_i1.p1 TRINITY_DN3354_c0_g5~~TRINITY_DN3354_c0_g5_i1.p1  ORF type:complete len:439 (+),score=45.56 TRINITY_DN3354_c0_g5_i1:70-1386(+)